jgi:HrpA-like RNA helicase
VIELPIEAYRETIEKCTNENPVTIITAETGAGKSTRVPYWFWEKNKKIHVTQPRRIAARSLSYYLSQFTSTRWGQQVGYQTGFDRKFSSRTTLLYLTDGVQMIKQIKGEDEYDILILDEIHEWNLNQEVLIGLIKKGLEKNTFLKKGKRVIVMSATLHAQKLSSFLNQSPVISVPGRGFPVTMTHNHRDFLLSDSVQMIEMGKNILVFQPGKSEIDAFIHLLSQTLEEDKLQAKIFPLHSELPIKDQARVFTHYPVPKVIVATDIAQTSLTIDDIDAVIDSGVKKEIRVIKGIEGLYPVDISHSECLQRAGRAGRVKNGQYILCADFAIIDRPLYPEPEIRRLNLESVVLRLIKWGLSPLEFPFFHSPKKNLIFKAIKQLKTFGAISADKKITADGEKMAELPVSIRGSRLLLEASKSSPEVFDSALKLIAILESKGILKRDEGGTRYYSDGIRSDLLNQLFAWDNAGLNKKAISFKKLALARDVYRELKKRMGVKKGSTRISPESLQLLTRCVLSAFVDRAYLKTGHLYIREGEERSLDRNSVLLPDLPDAVVGMPFDLVIERENRNTGEKEQMILPLITFATELSIKILENLRPFGYQGKQEITLKKNQLIVEKTIAFGEIILFQYASPPDWNDEIQKKILLDSVTGWCERNKLSLKFYIKLEETKRYFNQIKLFFASSGCQMPAKLSSFNFYWRTYLFRELKLHLKTDDLKLFFDIHPGFMNLNLNAILPQPFIQVLKKMKWPRVITISGMGKTIIRIKNRPFIKLTSQQFEKVKKEDLILPTGEELSIILNNRKFFDWDVTVYHFNRWKKQHIFEKKWKKNRKKIRIQDVVDIPFPISFHSGQSKENTPFEFFSAPRIEGKEIYLIHFYDKQKAVDYFESIKNEWKLILLQYKKQEIDSIFREKGWKIR